MQSSTPSGSQENPKQAISFHLFSFPPSAFVEGFIISGEQLSESSSLVLINNIPPWAKLLFASALLLAVPWSRKVQKAQDLNNTVEAAVEAAEMVVEAAEKMVEAAEKVVEKAEKVVEEVAEAFPNRRLKEFAIKVGANCCIC
ncbi:hypothetical protein HPP92_009131 [Vanilla planifolia]|uniref:Uncharacterized protein n=1 Tax=Vanilla planifolia TaxID=51239 RepID=A0A835RD92_VANPL|nr:hypothetical protein HPP92_009131 [Vanilla planifolia]